MLDDLEIIVELSDVYGHSLRTMDAISPSKPLLRFAALLHDIGKPPCKIEEENGNITFLNHETIGSEMAGNICKRLKMSSDGTKYVQTIIAEHMYYITDDTKKKTVKRWMANNPYYKDNLRLRIADRRGNLTKINKQKIPQKLKHLIRLVKEVEQEGQPLKVTDLAINGYDLINMGLTPSPLFRKILQNLLEDVLDNHNNNNKEYLLNRTKELLNDLS